jgi:hypothetical protein
MKNKPYPALLRPSNLSIEIIKIVPKSRETIPFKRPLGLTVKDRIKDDLCDCWGTVRLGEVSSWLLLRPFFPSSNISLASGGKPTLVEHKSYFLELFHDNAVLDLTLAPAPQ